MHTMLALKIMKQTVALRIGVKMKSVVYDNYMRNTYGGTSKWPKYGMRGLLPHSEPFKETRLRFTQDCLQRIYDIFVRSKKT
jgi:hypothetical protein